MINDVASARYDAMQPQFNTISQLIMFETNTASCRFPGISDSFRAALWAVGALIFYIYAMA